MDKKIKSAAEIIMEIISIEKDDVENYKPTYEEVLKICEQAKHDEDFDISFFNMMGLGNAEIVDIYDVLDDVHDYYDETPSYGDNLNASVEDYDEYIKARKMKEDYEVKYARGNVDLDDIQDCSEIRRPKTMSPAVKGTPHFKYEDSEKKRIGLGRRDYEAKYGTGGLLFEDIYNESRKESITKGKISPALKESIKAFETRKRLIENKIIDPKDLDLLNESEDDNYYDYGGKNQESFEEGDRVNTPEGSGIVSSVIRDGDDYYYEVELDEPGEYSMDGIETFDAWDLEKIQD